MTNSTLELTTTLHSQRDVPHWKGILKITCHPVFATWISLPILLLMKLLPGSSAFFEWKRQDTVEHLILRFVLHCNSWLYYIEGIRMSHCMHRSHYSFGQIATRSWKGIRLYFQVAQSCGQREESEARARKGNILFVFFNLFFVLAYWSSFPTSPSYFRCKETTPYPYRLWKQTYRIWSRATNGNFLVGK